MSLPNSPFPIAACILSALGLAVSLILGTLVFLEVVDVPWDGSLLPFLSAMVLVPYCLVAAVVSLVSCLVHRDRWSVLALILSLLAVPAAILTTLLVLLISAANNPV